MSQMNESDLRTQAQSYNYYVAWAAVMELRRRGLAVPSSVVGDGNCTVEGWDACCRGSGR